MLAYLVRHGEAVSKLEDPARPLSASGKAQIMRVGDLLARRFSLFPGHIFTSPKTRAAQTASLLGGMLPGEATPRVSEGLLPMDDPGFWAARLEELDQDTMLVGHLPHLSGLASLLLTGDSVRQIIDFTPGTISCLEKTDGWRLRWVLCPDVLRSAEDTGC